MRKEIIIHVDEGKLEHVLDILQTIRGVNLAGVNFIRERELINKLPKLIGERAPATKKKKRPSHLKGKGLVEGAVREIINDLPESKFHIDEVKRLAAGRYDGGQVQRAVQRMVNKKELKKLKDRGEYFAHKPMELAAANG